MIEQLIGAKRRQEIAAWKAILAEHQKPSFWRASWQIVNTIGSYLESSRWKRFAYRLARNSIVLFVIAPALFVVWQRFPSPKASRRERHSV